MSGIVVGAWGTHDGKPVHLPSFNEGVAEGIRQAREEVRMLPCYGTRVTGMRFDGVDRADVLDAIDSLGIDPR